jgi:hypothetical protein
MTLTGIGGTMYGIVGIGGTNSIALSARIECI